MLPLSLGRAPLKPRLRSCRIEPLSPGTGFIVGRIEFTPGATALNSQHQRTNRPFTHFIRCTKTETPCSGIRRSIKKFRPSLSCNCPASDNHNVDSASGWLPWLHRGLLFLDLGYRYVYMPLGIVLLSLSKPLELQRYGLLGSALSHNADLKIVTASGLYYLSELVEEHTVIAKRLLTQLIFGIIGLQAILWLIDGLPFTLSLMSIVSHVVYLGNMRRFPFVRLTDPLFIASCGMSWHIPSPYSSQQLTCSSAGTCQPLFLVPPLLCGPAAFLLPSEQHLRPARYTVLCRDRVILWHLRVVHTLCALCQLVRQR